MLSLYATLSLRYLQQRWFRAVLVVASIALGVTTLVATRALNESLMTATRAASTPLAGAADLHVSNGQLGLPARLIQPLSHIKGVRAVKPRLFAQAYIPTLSRTVRLIGIDLGSEIGDVASDIQIHPPSHIPELKEGARPVALGTRLAEELHEPGKVEVVLPGERRFELIVLGSVSANGPAAALVDNSLFMNLSDAAALVEPSQADYVTRFDLLLEPDADREEVRREAESLLAGRGEVITPEARGQDFHEVMSGLEIGFSLCGLGALVVGLFLVYNALSVTVAERRHDIGILRSLGATRGQIAGLFVGEAALLGLVGAVLGIPGGFGLAKLALGPVRDLLSDVFLPLEVARVEKSPSTFIAAGVGGLLTAILAGLLPALQGASQEPADAVRRVPHVPGWRQRWLHIAGIVLLIGSGLTLFALRGWLRISLPPRTGTYGGLILVLLGGMLAMPLLAAALNRVLLPLARRLLPIEDRLAADNLVRAPGRTGLVIAALAAGVALMFETAGLIRSNEEPILRWVDESIAADLFISSGGPVSASGQSQPMEAGMGERLEKAFPRQIDRALPVRFQPVHYRDTIVLIVAVDAAGYYRANKERGAPVPGLELYPQLAARPDAALVSDNFAHKHGVRVGDRLILPGRDRPVTLEIIGTLVDYSWNHGTVILDRARYQKQFGDDLVDVFDVYLRPGVDAAAFRQNLQDWKEPQFRPAALGVVAAAPSAGLPGSVPWAGLALARRGAEARPGEALFVLTRPELIDRIREMIQQLYGIAFLQEIIVGVVAVLGVVMALLISVLQRRREIGLLRAVGATQAQVLRSVVAEATLMGLIGTAIGILIGVPLECFVVRIILFDEAGLLFPVRIPWLDAGVIIVAAVLAAALAGLGPAIHALRQRIPEAIAYE
jgi:putative ABC transport system permease protein